MKYQQKLQWSYFIFLPYSYTQHEMSFEEEQYISCDNTETVRDGISVSINH